MANHSNDSSSSSNSSIKLYLSFIKILQYFLTIERANYTNAPCTRWRVWFAVYHFTRAYNSKASTPPLICRAHWTGVLKRTNISVFAMLIFIIHHCDLQNHVICKKQVADPAIPDRHVKQLIVIIELNSCMCKNLPKEYRMKCKLQHNQHILCLKYVTGENKKQYIGLYVKWIYYYLTIKGKLKCNKLNFWFNNSRAEF